MNCAAIREQLERIFLERFESTEIQEPLKAAASHALFPGGKRIRPMIALSLCADLGGDITGAVSPAAALELFHTSTLIHDDLPCLDNDDLRRGKPTVHKKFGEAIAVLTADVLLGICFEWITDVELSDGSRVALQEQLATAYRRVCNGQMLDILEDPSIRPDINIVHREKTGALFGASFAIGVILGDVRGDAAKKAKRVGESFGVLFQLLDDYLDEHGDPALRGRPKGSDARNQRATLLAETLESQLGRIRKALVEFKEHFQELKSALNTSELTLTEEILQPIIMQCDDILSLGGAEITLNV